ncbi:MAG TPA: cyclic nucleotide-binding domain-containing protein [Polyangiales bacterium]|nr:cyclic nucleotide-binding domain-containing protein [Polyangiales bacterium]
MIDDALERIEVGRVEQIHALRRWFGSAGPSTAALAALAAQLEAVRLPAGTHCDQSETTDGVIYFILEGELVAQREGRPFGSFGPRSVLGGLGVLGREPQSITFTAVRDTTALRLRGDDMFEVFEDHYELLQSAIEGLARNTIELRRLLTPHAGYEAGLSHDDEPLREPLGLIERMLVLRTSLAVQTHIDELAELGRAAQEVHYRAGSPLWFEGERATHMLVMVRGKVQAETAAGMSFQFGPSDLVGSLDTLANEPRWFNARAESNVIALALDRDALLDLVEDQAELGFDILRMLARVLTRVRERVQQPSAAALASQAVRT